MKRLVVLAGIVAILMVGVLAAFSMEKADEKPSPPAAAEVDKTTPAPPEPPRMGPGMRIQPEMQRPDMMRDREEMRERMRDHMRRMMKMRTLQVVLAHQDEMKLSEDQKGTLTQLRTDSEKKQMDTRSAMRKAQSEFDALVGADELDMDAIEKKAKEISVLEAESRLIPIRTSHKVMSMLTPDQKAKLEELSSTMTGAIPYMPYPPEMEPDRAKTPQPGTMGPDTSRMPQPGQAVPPEVEGVEVK